MKLTHSDDIWVMQPKKQSNLRAELLFQQDRQVLLLLRLADNLNGHINLVVNPSIDPTVTPRREFVADEELRHVSAPFFFSLTLNGRTRRDQVIGPRNCSLELPKRHLHPSSSCIVGDLLEKMEFFHGFWERKIVKVESFFAISMANAEKRLLFSFLCGCFEGREEKYDHESHTHFRKLKVWAYSLS